MERLWCVADTQLIQVIYNTVFAVVSMKTLQSNPVSYWWSLNHLHCWVIEVEHIQVLLLIFRLDLLVIRIIGWKVKKAAKELFWCDPAKNTPQRSLPAQRIRKLVCIQRCSLVLECLQSSKWDVLKKVTSLGVGQTQMIDPTRQEDVSLKRWSY